MNQIGAKCSVLNSKNEIDELKDTAKKKRTRGLKEFPRENKHIPEHSKVGTPMPFLRHTRNIINAIPFTNLASMKRLRSISNVFVDDSLQSDLKAQKS